MGSESQKGGSREKVRSNSRDGDSEWDGAGAWILATASLSHAATNLPTQTVQPAAFLASRQDSSAATNMHDDMDTLKDVQPMGALLAEPSLCTGQPVRPAVLKARNTRRQTGVFYATDQKTYAPIIFL